VLQRIHGAAAGREHRVEQEHARIGHSGGNRE